MGRSNDNVGVCKTVLSQCLADRKRGGGDIVDCTMRLINYVIISEGREM